MTNSSEQVIADLIGHSLPVRNDLCVRDASDLGQTWQSTLFPHGRNPVCALARLGLLEWLMRGTFFGQKFEKMLKSSRNRRITPGPLYNRKTRLVA